MSTTRTPEPLPPKMDVARALLLRGALFVHLDPRAESVRVPQWLKNQAQLVLQVGLDMPIPIPDLRVDDQGVFGTLSFQRSPFSCAVPWSAVFALVGEDGRGIVWPDDMPPEIASEVDREARRRTMATSLEHERLERSEPEKTPVTARSRKAPSRAQPAAQVATPATRVAISDARAPEPNDAARKTATAPGAKRTRVLPPYLRVIK